VYHSRKHHNINQSYHVIPKLENQQTKVIGPMFICFFPKKIEPVENENKIIQEIAIPKYARRIPCFFKESLKYIQK